MWNWSTFLLTALAVMYLYTTYTKFYYLMNPLTGVDLAAESTSGMINPLWRDGEGFKLIAFLSHTDKFYPYEISSLKSNSLLLIEKNDLVYSASGAALNVKLNIVEPSDDKMKNSALDSDRTTVMASTKVWENLRKGSSRKSIVYLHIQVIRSSVEKRFGPIDRVNKTFVESGDSLYGIVRMTKEDTLPKDFMKRYLLSDLGLVEEDDVQKERLMMDPLSKIAFWKPEVAVRIVTDFTEYPKTFIPPAIGVHVVALNKRQRSESRENFYI